MEENEKLKAYYLAIEEDGETILWKSEKFALNEIDLINLVKICFVQRRAVDVGKKILNVYLDCNSHRKDKINEILKNIGVKIQNNEPTKIRKTKNR